MTLRKNKNKFGSRFLPYSLLWLSLLLISGNPVQQYPPGRWDTIIENQVFKTPLNLDEGDDNVLIINSTFYNINEDAITLRNVSNVYIKDCVIHGISGNGIVLSSIGKTDNVTIDGCTIYDTTKNGIIAKQDHVERINHTRLVIKNNTLYNNGSSELDHGLYVLAQDTIIQNNEIHESAGNGISIRSSGIVSGNKIWDTQKSCIRYFSDNETGPSNTLLIENNTCHLTLGGAGSPAISLLWWEEASPKWIVDNYIIRFNTVVVFTDERIGISVESSQLESKNINIYGNVVINTQSLDATIRKDYVDYLSSNYISTSLDGFVNLQTKPFDLHLTALSPAVDYANTETDFPLIDMDGMSRSIEHLDAGAYQLERYRYYDPPAEILIGAGVVVLIFAIMLIFKKRVTT
jgi:hypothetical protein